MAYKRGLNGKFVRDFNRALRPGAPTPTSEQARGAGSSPTKHPSPSETPGPTSAQSRFSRETPLEKVKGHVQAALESSRDFGEFAQALASHDIALIPKVTQRDASKVTGLYFEYDGQRFKGSYVSRQVSWGQLTERFPYEAHVHERLLPRVVIPGQSGVHMRVRLPRSMQPAPSPEPSSSPPVPSTPGFWELPVGYEIPEMFQGFFSKEATPVDFQDREGGLRSAKALPSFGVSLEAPEGATGIAWPRSVRTTEGVARLFSTREGEVFLLTRDPGVPPLKEFTLRTQRPELSRPAPAPVPPLRTPEPPGHPALDAVLPTGFVAPASLKELVSQRQGLPLERCTTGLQGCRVLDHTHANEMIRGILLPGVMELERGKARLFLTREGETLVTQEPLRASVGDEVVLLPVIEPGRARQVVDAKSFDALEPIYHARTIGETVDALGSAGATLHAKLGERGDITSLEIRRRELRLDAALIGLSPRDLLERSGQRTEQLALVLATVEPPGRDEVDTTTYLHERARAVVEPAIAPSKPVRHPAYDASLPAGYVLPTGLETLISKRQGLSLEASVQGLDGVRLEAGSDRKKPMRGVMLPGQLELEGGSARMFLRFQGRDAGEILVLRDDIHASPGEEVVVMPAKDVREVLPIQEYAQPRTALIEELAPLVDALPLHETLDVLGQNGVTLHAKFGEDDVVVGVEVRRGDIDVPVHYLKNGALENLKQRELETHERLPVFATVTFPDGEEVNAERYLKWNQLADGLAADQPGSEVLRETVHLPEREFQRLKSRVLPPGATLDSLQRINLRRCEVGRELERASEHDKAVLMESAKDLNQQRARFLQQRDDRLERQRASRTEVQESRALETFSEIKARMGRETQASLEFLEPGQRFVGKVMRERVHLKEGFFSAILSPADTSRTIVLVPEDLTRHMGKEVAVRMDEKRVLMVDVARERGFDRERWRGDRTPNNEGDLDR